jgi:uncharacterized protein YbaA (DUF1428 family)
MNLRGGDQEPIPLSDRERREVRQLAACALSHAANSGRVELVDAAAPDAPMRTEAKRAVEAAAEEHGFEETTSSQRIVATAMFENAVSDGRDHYVRTFREQ